MDYRRESSIDHRKEKKKKHDRSRSHDKKKKSKDRSLDREHKKKDKKHKGKERSRDRQRSRDRREPQRARGYQDRSLGRNRDYDRDRRDRDRTKEHKHKSHRSRSHSKKKKHGGHKERAKEDGYEKWRRQRDEKFRFDSPPKSDESIQSDQPEKMDRLNKMKAEKELVSSKADRKLYLGNLPPNITSNQLMDMLNSALKKMEINTDSDGDSIVSAWVSPDGVGHYAFVEFRSAMEATAGLALNGASLYGYQLKLGRPKQYIEYQKQLLNQFGSDSNIDTILKKVQAMGGFNDPENPIVPEQRLVCPPGKVIILKHIVTIEELAIDEEYSEIYEDMMEMAKRFGDVQKLLIPRPMEIDLEQIKRRVKGLGFIFIKYKTVDQARYARKEFIKKMFSDRTVACSYFPEKKLEGGDLDPVDKIVIDF